MLDAHDTPELIDLHCHILPDVDDGAWSDSEAIAMLTAAAADGIGTVLATPHAHHVHADRVRVGVERLRTLAADAGIAVTILPGHEARIGADLVDRYRQGALLTLNDTAWLLLECYLFDDWPLHLVERSVDRLIDAGLRPLLAHAERYPFVQRDPSALLTLIKRGIPIQINARSLTFRPDDRERVTAEYLLQRRMAHVIASDSHNARYNPPALSAAYARAAEITSDDYACWMRQVSVRIVAGDEVVLPDIRDR